uniref:Uncharacterized protein n=1 Tax=Musa acuminata subsp. malaccensis TaxID=214687 RepID=A0A804JDG7_MUSAM
MVSPPSSSPSLPPLSGAAGEEVALASSRSSSEERATKALESLMWPHDLDSTVSESSLVLLRDRYCIPAEFALIAPEPGQRAYDPSWSFGLRWAARAVDNTAPALDEGELGALRRLMEILPSSRVIRRMTEAWLVEAGLSPVPREMVNLPVVRGGRISSAASPRRQVGSSVGTREAPVDLEDVCPRKKTKVAAAKKPTPPRAQGSAEAADPLGGADPRDPGVGRRGDRDRAARLRAKAGAADERALALEAEVLRLRSEAKAAEEEKGNLRGLLEGAQSEARLARGEAVVLTQRLEGALADVKGASEALAAERERRPEKEKEIIEAYKQSSGFQLGLARSGQVTYEYGYRIALGRFQTSHPGLEVEADPFVSHPEDLDVDMPEEVPFDDGMGRSDG